MKKLKLLLYIFNKIRKKNIWRKDEKYNKKKHTPFTYIGVFYKRIILQICDKFIFIMKKNKKNKNINKNENENKKIIQWYKI